MSLIVDSDALHTAARAGVMHARERALVHARGPVDLGKALGLWYPLGVRTFARQVRDLLDQVEQAGVTVPAEVRAAIDERIGDEDVVYIQVPESEVPPMLWMLATFFSGTEGATHFRYRDGMLTEDPSRFRPGQRLGPDRPKP